MAVDFKREKEREMCGTDRQTDTQTDMYNIECRVVQLIRGSIVR